MTHEVSRPESALGRAVEIVCNAAESVDVGVVENAAELVTAIETLRYAYFGKTHSRSHGART